MTTIEQINAHLHQLGWQAYIPAFAELLQRFEGTENYLETADGQPVTDEDTLPCLLSRWLESMTCDNPKPIRLALFALRHWCVLYFRAKANGQLWDYRKIPFHPFCQAQGLPITTWTASCRVADPTLAQGLGFLRQHRLAAGKQG
ncbi:MAG: hypothetical protein PHE17_20095 [Thiothrix sp.]|uniref:hypothetical protein n=1 Tax=Thiothrix sp. TaxID=1032 RepID=UPI002609600D|nr:hypothetical protein [Thiothrix sp.]MDD5395332.1 hypothetical protein [Thiothrix sp.]